MKRLIVCCDGTWNTPEQEENNLPAPTNVVRLRNALADSDADAQKNPQLAYYHTGVGTEGGMLARTVGGVFGDGLDKNIQSAYAWLAGNYAAGDAIYFFGFSRGAYTVRSLGGLIGRCGLPALGGVSSKEAWLRIDTAYQHGYQQGQPAAQWRGSDWAWWEPADVPIAFIGVWDTVGALGIPDDLALLNLFDHADHWRFYDTKLGIHVVRARHATAIDEMRASFTPTLWTDDAGNALNDGDRVKQIWFPGVHSDVGGGYGATGLSDIALRWMMDEAQAAGLRFRPGALAQIKTDDGYLGPLHDSLKGVFARMHSEPRAIPLIEPGSTAFHPCVMQRHENPPITQAPYHPTHRLTTAGESFPVPVFAREHWNATGIFLEAGVEYEFSATGEWMDRSITSDASGSADGRFEPAEIAHLIGSALGTFENMFHKVSGNQTADLKFTKRVEEAPWFALIGVIANGGNPQADGTPAPHEQLAIKAGPLRATPKRSGYLHAFANDAWDFYGNNRGSVMLTVTRLT